METTKTTFTASDLKESMKYVEMMFGMPVVEQPLNTQDERLEKYISLRDLRDFLASSRGSEDYQILKNKTLLGLMAQRGETQPLEYDSDDDLLVVNSANCFRKVDADICEHREDENGVMLQQIPEKSAEMSPEQQIKLIIDNVRTLFEKERGKDAAKKLNLRDVMTTRVETADLLQQPLISEDVIKSINRHETIIRGNVKAMIPLFRERLQLEYVQDPAGSNDLKPRYKRGTLEPLYEKKIFGILTPY